MRDNVHIETSLSQTTNNLFFIILSVNTLDMKYVYGNELMNISKICILEYNIQNHNL